MAARWQRRWCKPALAALTLGPAAFALISVHPFELSYYNKLIGGPRGAWNAGFELSYWYDAFTPEAIADIQAKLPEGAWISHANQKSDPIMVFQDLQSLVLRGDLVALQAESWNRFPYVWLLTHDSKADCFSRLLFAMTPIYALEPRQLDGTRVASVFDPKAVECAWALQLMLDKSVPSRREPPRSPTWVRDFLPPLARFWGDGLTKSPPLNINEDILSCRR